MNAPDGVRRGQIWADTHTGNKGRTIRIERTDTRHAYCTVVTCADDPATEVVFGLKISHNNHRGLRGYWLVSDPRTTPDTDRNQP
jgi:hypothetical protein